MNDEEKYLFDLRGYLVIEDVLGPEELIELHALLDEKDLWRSVDNGDIYSWQNDPKFVAVGAPHAMEAPFRALVEHPKLMPYLREAVGDGFRYDHGHIMLLRRGATTLGLHGGNTPFSPVEYYLFKDGHMFNGLVAIAISLVDAGPDDGGFACIPGSHKANYRCPDHIRTFENSDPIIRVPVKAGSAIMFTEALTHGTWPWTADHERRGVFLKYTPGHMAYSGDYPKVADVPEDCDWSERARRILTPPFSVSGNDEQRRPTVVGDGVGDPELATSGAARNADATADSGETS